MEFFPKMLPLVQQSCNHQWFSAKRWHECCNRPFTVSPIVGASPQTIYRAFSSSTFKKTSSTFPSGNCFSKFAFAKKLFAFAYLFFAFAKSFFAPGEIRVAGETRRWQDSCHPFHAEAQRVILRWQECKGFRQFDGKLTQITLNNILIPSVSVLFRIFAPN